MGQLVGAEFRFVGRGGSSAYIAGPGGAGRGAHLVALERPFLVRWTGELVGAKLSFVGREGSSLRVQ